MSTETPYEQARISNPAFVPHRLTLRDRPHGWLAQLWHLSRNPIDIWVQHHDFEAMIAVGPGLIGTVALVNDPAGIKRILVDNAANYEKDPLQLRVLAAGTPKSVAPGLLIASGETWRRARRTLAPLFTPRRVESMARTMRTTAEARVDAWLMEERPGNGSDKGAPALAIDREMSALTYDILSATMFSNALAGSGADVERQLSILLNAIGRLHPFDVFAFPDWVPRVGSGRGARARKFFEKAMKALLDSRLTEARNGRSLPDDLLSALIRASDPETGMGLEHDEIIAHLFTFIAAGHETTARALTWTLYLLSQDPEWEGRCIEEAKQAPDDPGQWLETLPVIRAAFEEAMRLFPPAPQLSRIAGADDIVAGTEIRAGTLMIIAPWVLHRHRKLWREPDAFVPSRFLPGNRDSIGRFAYLPFGAGPRICIGQLFAMQEAVIVLACILRRLRLRYSGPTPKPLHRITLRPDVPLKMHIEPHCATQNYATKPPIMRNGDRITGPARPPTDAHGRWDKSGRKHAYE